MGFFSLFSGYDVSDIQVASCQTSACDWDLRATEPPVGMTYGGITSDLTGHLGIEVISQGLSQGIGFISRLSYQSST